MWLQDQEQQQRHHSATMEEDQNRIGWDRLLDGWLSQCWRHQQEQVWSQIHSKKSSQRWMSAFIQKLWDITWDMWDHQNKELHLGGQDQQQILHSTVNAQIEAAYKGRAQQLPRDALHLLHNPKTMVLQYPIESKQLWLTSIQAAQQCQRHHRFGWYQGKQHFMIMWLQTATNPNMANNTQSD